ncbi:hypothetical protein [Kitasatospora viridis]|uniref:hypothetical protein n=1 Tax=Kitasatospora viridis TaxID=281105 RepID=UPI0011A895DF|nr:hypothetical protein [Kitasatospora viridis]
MRFLIVFGSAFLLSQLVVWTLVVNVFGLGDGGRLLLALVEFVAGLLVLSIVMAALPRRLKQQVAGAQPTSAMMRRRVDGLLVKLGGIAPRTARADVVALASGVALYTRAVRIDGERPLLGTLLFEAPSGGQAVLRWRRGTAIETLPAPYQLTELADVPLTAVARSLKASGTVRIGGAVKVQLTAMDLELLRHVTTTA